jgi:ribonuclease-3
VADLLYRRLPDADEGQLSRRKSNLVSRRNLARAFEHADLAPACLVGTAMGATWPDSVKANLVEAIFGAAFLDGGWPALCAVVEHALAPFLDDPGSDQTDARMQLQAWSLEQHRRLPDYRCERSGGTDHDPLFTATAAIAGLEASGSGTSRRRAEAAAAAALMAQVRAQGGPASSSC